MEDFLVFCIVFAAVALESSVLPLVPLEALLVPATVSNQLSAAQIFVAAVSASGAGSVLGGLIGRKSERMCPTHIKKRVDEVEEFVEDYRSLGVFVAALTPVPYTITTVSAGVLGIDLKKLLAASLVGRGIRAGMIIYGTKLLEGTSTLVAGLTIAVLGTTAFMTWRYVSEHLGLKRLTS